VMRARLVEPEDGGRIGSTSAVDGKFDPVLDSGVLGLARTPDIAFLDGMFNKDVPAGVDDAHNPVGWYLKRLVMRAVFLRRLRHQADVRYGTHRARIESAMFFAKIDRRLVNAGVAAVRNDGKRVLELACRVVHLARG